jgi:hypothetical protein
MMWLGSNKLAASYLDFTASRFAPNLIGEKRYSTVFCMGCVFMATTFPSLSSSKMRLSGMASVTAIGFAGEFDR